MNVTIVAVGTPSRLLEGPIREFETRAARYWKLQTTEVDPAKASRNRPVTDVRKDEAENLLAAVPDATEIVAVTRTGTSWSSRDLARYLNGLAVAAATGATFIIGGAYGLDRQLVQDATRRVSLSALTMPHELARLVLAEQLYRAGTIIRGEPYHKG